MAIIIKIAVALFNNHVGHVSHVSHQLAACACRARFAVRADSGSAGWEVFCETRRPFLLLKTAFCVSHGFLSLVTMVHPCTAVAYGVLPHATLLQPCTPQIRWEVVIPLVVLQKTSHSSQLRYWSCRFSNFSYSLFPRV